MQQGRLLKDTAHLSPHHQISSVEAFFSLILKFAPKNVTFTVYSKKWLMSGSTDVCGNTQFPFKKKNTLMSLLSLFQFVLAHLRRAFCLWVHFLSDQASFVCWLCPSLLILDVSASILDSFFCVMNLWLKKLTLFESACSDCGVVLVSTVSAMAEVLHLREKCSNAAGKHRAAALSIKQNDPRAQFCTCASGVKSGSHSFHAF